MSERLRLSISFCLGVLIPAYCLATIFSDRLLGQGTSAASPRPDFSAVREYINSRMAATSTPSMVVAVARGNEILWEEGFGWLDRPGGTPATPDTLYYAASVTKAVTATALMVLHERRQLDLDRPANRYLKHAGLRSPLWNPAEATVRRVATHSAGLTTYDSREQIPAAEIMRRYGVIFWRPGERFDYSNFGFGVLGQIIQDVSGRSYQSFVHEEVLRPLGMENAWAGAAPKTKQPVASRFSALSRAFSPPLSEPTMPGASVLFVSAHELALFGMFHLQTPQKAQKAILSDAAIKGLQEPNIPAGSGRQSLAWSINENRYGSVDGDLATRDSDLSGNLPLVLSVRSGEIDATLGKQQTVKMTGIRFFENRVIGRMRGDIGIDDDGSTPYELRVELDRHANKLIGAAVTYALEGYEGPRLPFWVELRRGAPVRPQ